MSETIKNIKNFNIGDKVTSTTSILLDRGFRGVTGTIRTIVKDEADSWQYLIDLDDGRTLQCDDWHLKQPTLNENQQQVLGWLKIGHCDGDSVFEALERITYVYEDPKTEKALESLTKKQEAQVIQSFISWVLEQETE